jgi:phospholipid/cholesterol/gamma-HCH transport system substrate-binding protein
MRDETKRNLRVGMLTAVALAVLAFTILSIGNRRQLFIRHTRYHTSFRNVTGLQPGAQVNLNGVTVGFVERIELPTDPERQRITVRFTLDDRYTERIRADTTVSIKTIGLLGDKYLELRGGSPDQPRVLEGDLVEGQDAAEMAQFVASGEDLMENLLSISSSLRVILRRVEAGEGLLGELTSTPEGGGKVRDLLDQTLSEMHGILKRIDSGQGLLGRLVADDEMGQRLLDQLDASTGAVHRAASTINDDLARDGTVYAALLRDPEGARHVVAAVQAMRDASQAIAAAAEELTSGEGTLPRLLDDREYADTFLEDLQGLVHSMRSVSDKLDQGTGTAGAFVNDPQLYQDIEHVVRGVKDSTVVSWFIRNRRRKGEELAAEEAAQADRAAGETGRPAAR